MLIVKPDEELGEYKEIGKLIDSTEHKRVTPPFMDESLICCECGARFLFSAGEKYHFYDHDFDYPRRCAKCRQARKRKNHPPTNYDEQ